MPESERRTVSFRTLALETGPRFARDALGPALVFYLGWKLVGLAVGVLAATLFALVAYGWERTRARSGLSAGVGLGIALVQAAAALASGSAIAYFGPPVIINGAYGLAFVVSVVIGRPLAGIFAQETYPFSPEVRASATFRRERIRLLREDAGQRATDHDRHDEGQPVGAVDDDRGAEVRDGATRRERRRGLHQGDAEADASGQARARTRALPAVRDEGEERGGQHADGEADELPPE